MKATRTLPLAAALVVATLLAGCSQSEKPTASESTPKPSASSSVSPSPSASNADGPIYLTSSEIQQHGLSGLSLKWRGGMVGGTALKGGTATVVGWTPGMSEVAVCELEPWQDGETQPTDTVVDTAIDVMATTGDKPVVMLLYPALTEASGLDAQTTHVYAQSVDLSSCSLGERVDVAGEVPKDLTATAPQFVGTSENVLAVAPFSSLTTSLPDVSALIGIDAGKGSTAWKQSFPGKQIEVRSDYLEGAQNNESVFDLGVQDNSQPAATQVRTLVSVATGETVAKAGDFEAPSVSLGEDAFLYTDASGEGVHDPQTVAENGKTKQVSGGVMAPTAVAGDDGEGNRVLVGFYCAADASDCDLTGSGHALGYVGTDASIHEILPASKVESLGLKLLGFSDGNLYVETTSEHLIVGLDGKQVGDAYDEDKFPFHPVAETSTTDGLWTLWATDTGISGGSADYAITKDGEQPENLL